jgi:phenylpropionate dioxygenase-like ring-hydroxylating dioxygenase large terminal subunit
MPYSWKILVENLCDPAHVNFAHHSFMGGTNHNQENQVLDIKVTMKDSQGFKAQKDPYPSRGTYDVKFQAPSLLFYSIASDNDTFLGLGQ